MTYDKILELITLEFIGECLRLSLNFKKNMGLYDIAEVTEEFKGEAIKKSDDHSESLITFEALLFEAWIGWNRQHVESGPTINMAHDGCLLFDGDGIPLTPVIYYSELTAGKPLLPEIQALIWALSSAMGITGEQGELF